MPEVILAMAWAPRLIHADLPSAMIFPFSAQQKRVQRSIKMRLLSSMSDLR